MKRCPKFGQILQKPAVLGIPYTGDDSTWRIFASVFPRHRFLRKLWRRPPEAERRAAKVDRLGEPAIGIVSGASATHGDCAAGAPGASC